MHFADRVEFLHESFRRGYLSGEFSDPELQGEVGMALGRAMRPFSELCTEAESGAAARSLCVAHLDAHLKGNWDASAFLEGDLEATFARRNITIEVERRRLLGRYPSEDGRRAMKNGTITTSDGRIVSFADYGMPGQTAVVWCHGGPGSRLEPAYVSDSASSAGLRLIGIDRPGYGRSTPQAGRTIGGWVPDAIAVLDHLGIDRFVVVGLSTGGAYALALASLTSRVIGAVACCAVSDMRWADGKAMNVSCHPVWNARDRHEAVGIVTAMFGEHGENLLPPLGPPGADPSDSALCDARLSLVVDQLRSRYVQSRRRWLR